MSKLSHFLSLGVGVVVVHILHPLYNGEFQSQVVAETSEVVGLGLIVALLHVVHMFVKEVQLDTGSSELVLGSLEGGVLGAEDIISKVSLLHVDRVETGVVNLSRVGCCMAIFGILDILYDSMFQT